MLSGEARGHDAPRTYQVTIGDRVLVVAVRRAGAATFVRVDDGEERQATLEPLCGQRFALRMGERLSEVLLERARESVAVAAAGVQLRAEVVDEARARLAQVAAGRHARHARHELKAPMPGLVVRVPCQVGDRIAAGQPLVVLQAMKMENELSLPRDGTVSGVRVQPGETVDQGQVLVVVE